MRVVRTVLALTVVCLIAAPLFSAENCKPAKKGPACPAAQFVDGMTKGLTLTDDQKAKIADIEKEFGPKLVAAQKAGEVLTPEQKKAAGEAAKAAKAAGKSGKEAHQAVDAAVKLTDDQKAKQADAKKQVGGLQKELREKVMGVLTQEQKDQIKPHHGKKAK